MKKIAFTLIFLASFHCFSQSTGPFAIWEDQQNGGYYFVRLNAATGAKTNINLLAGISGFVLASKSAFDTYNNYYYFVAQSGSNARLFTIDAATGTPLSNPIMTDNVVGIEYNCADSMLYGIKVVANSYSLCTVDPATAVATTIAPINNISGYVGGSFSLDPVNGHYHFIANTFTNGYRLQTFNIQTGALVYDKPFPDNVVGHRYNPVDGNVYGLWDNSNSYKLEKMDFANGTHSTVGTLTGVDPGYVTESHSMNEIGHYTFRGFNGPSFALFSVDVSNASVLSANNTATANNTVGFEEPDCAASTGVSNVIAKDPIDIFPNPASNFIFLRGSEKISKLELFNCMGGKVYSIEDVIPEKLPILYPDGYYYLRLEIEGNIFSKKIVIQK